MGAGDAAASTPPVPHDSVADVSDEPTVWVLGAGFSKGLGGPLIQDLLSHRELPVLQTLSPGKTHTGVAEEQLKARLFSRYGQERRYWDHAEQFLDLVETAEAEEDFEEHLADKKDKAGATFSHGHLLLRTMLKNTVRYPETETIEQGAREKYFKQVPGPAHNFGSIRELAVATRRALAADCSLFLRSAGLGTERWSPYVDWAQQLGPRDTVVTFNYDHAPELLATVDGSKLRIIEPAKELGPLIESVRRHEGKAPVLKVHGSVTWRRNGNAIEPLKLGDPAIGDPRTDVVIGVPGPGKRFLIRETLRSLWSAMLTALAEARHVIFVGYRFPPTDADSRRDLLATLGATAKRGVALRVQTVLGPRTDSDESIRLAQLLGHAGVGNVHPVPLYAEDFLGLPRQP